MKHLYSALYTLIDDQGNGILSRWLANNKNLNNKEALMKLFEKIVVPFLYNDGNGKLIPISDLVMLRNKQRNAMLSTLRRKKGRGKRGPNILDEIDINSQSNGDFRKALKILDGCTSSTRAFKYRELVWEISERGTMGENLLHMCLLHNTNKLKYVAKELVKQYPKLVNDIFISEEYYGLSPLHQAIVNEDLPMVYFLLKNGADVRQRCYGSFFCAEDQKASRTDSLEHEWVDLDHRTRYTGQMYWGEYPMAFAACGNQYDCVRLLKVFKSDPNLKDTNGNTVLHLCVIHGLEDMAKLIYEMGGKLSITNNLGFTPMALSARLAKKEMFDLMLDLGKETLWTYRDTTCYAYSLKSIDTVDEINGHLNTNSILSLVVYGESSRHLNFFDGLLEEILEKKWEAFGKRMLFRSLIGYLIYLVAFYTAFMTREILLIDTDNQYVYSSNYSLMYQEYRSSCYLWNYEDKNGKYYQKARMIGEIVSFIIALLVNVFEIKEMIQVGQHRWWKMTTAFPEKALYKMSLIIVIGMFCLRLSCFIHPNIVQIENILVIIAAFLSTTNFLFYCRVLKFVGPFVIMVYKIIVGDMFRFLLIYLIFLISFSQAFFILFLSCEREKNNNITNLIGNKDEKFDNILQQPSQTIMRMFLMSVGEFSALYQNIYHCKSSLAIQGKIIFLVYELLVTVMLLNLLIAMMTRTYEKISETHKEWKRQWAQVILMIEQSLSPQERLLYMLNYSRPLKADTTQRGFLVRKKIKKNI
ncbi:Nanchung [Strongyloides ratti]|uniref:Nanchung n=1 Tax=Strongyloides ratti TaxID=34506 RepID=A0A090KW31_STRRB|nr:Nanchung [Strongyloides ratti]CEF60086.1 Nanchung [Strongyloides ratti]